MNTYIQTQKIYTFPERELYGEYCCLSLLELRVKMAKGEVKEQLCFLDENDRAYLFDEFGVPESHADFYLESKGTKLLMELLDLQFKKLKEKRNEQQN